jgi:N-acetylneuraminate synthase
VNNQTYIIAEAGVNHNGSIDMAKELIRAAADSGVNAVKFQTFSADKIVARSAPKAAYQVQATGSGESQYHMLKKLELSVDAHFELVMECKKNSIDFLSTPFDEESVDLLVCQLGVQKIKISSGDITNAPLLLRAAQSHKPIILSTGMSTLSDIEAALGVLAFGYGAQTGSPSISAFETAYASGTDRMLLQDRVTLLHCTTEYPASFAEVNLRAMTTLRHSFGLSVGYSDHTTGMEVAVAAVAMGASMIEKHFTLDQGLPGPDHRASLEPNDLKAMVLSIRNVEQALGSIVKCPSISEAKNRVAARKSLVALRDIKRGDEINADNLTAKRPGDGVSPMQYWEWMGKISNKDFSQDERLHP